MSIVLPGKQRFGIATPLDTHWAQASCREIECANYTGGWVTVLDESDPRQADLADMVRNVAGREYTESKESGVTRFTFAPGQQCFDRHVRKLDKPEIYTHGTTSGTRRFDRPQDWTENMNEELFRVGRGQA